MRVSFDVPDKVWASLASKADGRGVKVADLLVEAVVSAAAPKHRSRVLPLKNAADRARVQSLYELNRSAYEIAREMRVGQERVLSTLMDMGLPAGRRFVKKEK